MNTRISYLYRDGANFKQNNEEIMAGELSFDDLLPFLDEGMFFTRPAPTAAHGMDRVT